jgi:5-bromo-4-chloroindolyl phosphate hydrolysis protein
MGLISSILGKKAKEVQSTAVEMGQELTLAVVVADGKKMVNTLIDCSNAVESTVAADLITDVAFAMQALYDDFVMDQRDVKVAEDFIVYHAPKAVAVIEAYTKAMTERTGKPEEMALVEESMRQMKASFETMLAKCEENDNEGLAVQSETLRRILEIETPTLSR